MKGRAAAILMSVLLLLYLVLVVQLAIRLIFVDSFISKTLGAALLVFPLLGAWALLVELRFGVSTQRLVRRLDGAGDLPQERAAVRRASGRPDRAQALAEFDRYRVEVEADPESWQAWFRLGLSYDGCGDRQRARRALRKAIALESGSR